MASNWPQDPDSVLRGLFGNIVASAAGGLSTADVWSNLRTAASNWASSVLSLGSAGVPSEQDVNDLAAQMLSHVSAADVSRYRGIAGSFLQAKANLAGAGPGDQITGGSIFTPPWATTADNPAIPTQYRLRILRTIYPFATQRFTRQEWNTYDLTGPLTSLEDAINQANAKFQSANYNRTSTIVSVDDAVIETV